MAFDPTKFINPAQYSDLGAITGFDSGGGAAVPPREAMENLSPSDKVKAAFAPANAIYATAAKMLAKNNSPAIPGVESSVQMPQMEGIGSYDMGTGSGGFDFSSTPHR